MQPVFSLAIQFDHSQTALVPTFAQLLLNLILLFIIRLVLYLAIAALQLDFTQVSWVHLMNYESL